jgi:quinol monooxygenase YgiN
MPFVSITRLRLRSWRFLPGQLWHALRSSRHAKAAPGNLAVRLLREPNNTFWTCSVWSDEAAMRTFMLSGAHRKAMPRLIEWCDKASVAHWQQDTAEPPAWHEAHRRMQAEGRPSKVRHPSEAHQRFDIPAPR